MRVTAPQAHELLTRLERTLDRDLSAVRATLGPDGIDAARLCDVVGVPASTVSPLLQSLETTQSPAGFVALQAHARPVFETAAPLTDAERAAMRSVIVPTAVLSTKLERNLVFREWVRLQVGHNPVTQATSAGLARAMYRNEPKTVADVLTMAIDEAKQQVATIPNAPTSQPQRDHLVIATAALALAGHGFVVARDAQPGRFPPFLPDGRAVDFGHDKSRHCVNHLMFSFIALYDQTYGDGAVARGFFQQVDWLDAHGLGAAVGQLYDEVKGAVTPLLKAFPKAPPETVSLYAARPQGLDEREAKAYDAAVRVGDFYEAASSQGVSLHHIGLPQGPIAPNDSTEGLSDPGTTRDLTANRIGARLGVELFRDPSRLPFIPHDVGRDLPGIAKWT